VSGAADSSLPPGDYVRIKMSITGVGMDKHAGPGDRTVFHHQSPGWNRSGSFRGPWNSSSVRRTATHRQCTEHWNTMSCGCRGPHPYRIGEPRFDISEPASTPVKGQ